MWTFVAATAVVVWAIQLVPQAWGAIRARDLNDVSLPTFLLICLTTFLWATYGLHLGDPAIVGASGVAFVCALTISLMKVKKGQRVQPAS